MIYVYFERGFNPSKIISCETKLTLLKIIFKKNQTDQLYVWATVMLAISVVYAVYARCLYCTWDFCLKYAFTALLCKFSTFVCCRDFQSLRCFWRLKTNLRQRPLTFKCGAAKSNLQSAAPKPQIHNQYEVTQSQRSQQSEQCVPDNNNSFIIACGVSWLSKTSVISEDSG